MVALDGFRMAVAREQMKSAESTKIIISSKIIILFIIQYTRTAHFGGVLVVPQGSQIAEAEGGNKQILGG